MILYYKLEYLLKKTFTIFIMSVIFPDDIIDMIICSKLLKMFELSLNLL